MRRLIERFHRSACHDSPAQVIAALYAYESQVPGISGEKARALLRHYGADDVTCGYFALHTYADVHHSQVWREELQHLIQDNCRLAKPALDAAARAAYWFWQALDACHAYRLSERAMLVA